MKYYTYYPGCSSDATGLGQHLSLKAIAAPLEMELPELEEWNCCGSTPYGSLDEGEALVVAARNLALAEKRGLDVVTPCSSCFVTLYKANEHLQESPALLKEINNALAAAGLEYRGTLRIRHIVDVLFSDLTPEFIKSKVKRPLSGLKVAPYYGCQLVRPKYGPDAPDAPESLDRLVAALGAENTEFPLKTRCCGASQILAEEGMALGFIADLLENAREHGAECLVTACPLCQTNLDAYQGRALSRRGAGYRLPVLYITQLIGLALGLDARALGLDTNIVPAAPLAAQLAGMGEAV